MARAPPTLLWSASLFIALTEAASVVNFQLAGLGDGQRAKAVQTFSPAVANVNKTPSYLSGLAAYAPFYPQNSY